MPKGKIFQEKNYNFDFSLTLNLWHPGLINLTLDLILIGLCLCLPHQDHSPLKVDRRRHFPVKWPSTPCGCVLSSRLLSPPATCGTASSSTSTAVYFECADEARVFIGPLEKPQDQLVCGPASYLPPRWMNVHFKQWRDLTGNKQKNIGRQVHTDYKYPYKMKLVTGIVNLHTTHTTHSLWWPSRIISRTRHDSHFDVYTSSYTYTLTRTWLFNQS